jgi:thioredoxin 1
MSLQPYTPVHPTRAEVEALPGKVIIEFGVDWCPHCQRAAEPVAAALATAGLRVADSTGAAIRFGVAAGAPVAATTDALQYWRLEDERARPLGRSFKVKLWPTLLFLQDGVEVARVVRPTTVAELVAGMEQWGSNREVQP